MPQKVANTHQPKTLELAFSSVAQALVQINAPASIRGRVIGLFNMSALGLRAFIGITVGTIGAVVGVHLSLAGAAVALLAFTSWLWIRQRVSRAQASIGNSLACARISARRTRALPDRKEA